LYVIEPILIRAFKVVGVSSDRLKRVTSDPVEARLSKAPFNCATGSSLTNFASKWADSSLADSGKSDPTPSIHESCLATGELGIATAGVPSAQVSTGAGALPALAGTDDREVTSTIAITPEKVGQ
jgi:hypothetical protein